MDVVRTLHRAHHRHLTVARNSDHALRLDIELLLMRDSILALDDLISRGESLVDVTPSDQEPLEDIVVAVKNFSTGEGLLDREHRRQLFVLDLNMTRGSFKFTLACGSDQQNRFIEVAHL